MGKMIISAFADEYDKSFAEQLRALAGFGIEYIELRFLDGKNVSELTPKEVSEAKKRLDDCGIRVNSIGSPLGKIALDRDIEQHMELSRGVFEKACEFGTKRVRMFSFYPAEGRNINDCRDEVMEQLDKMITLAERYEITLCHENEAKIYGESAENCLEIMERFNGRIKSVFDMGNFTLDRYDPYASYELLKDHIEYFHIKDALSAGAIVPPGKGEARIKDILSDFVKKTDRSVFITLEPHLQTFSGLNALTDSKFDNPYKYETQQAAFADAVIKLKELVTEVYENVNL